MSLAWRRILRRPVVAAVAIISSALVVPSVVPHILASIGASVIASVIEPVVAPVPTIITPILTSIVESVALATVVVAMLITARWLSWTLPLAVTLNVHSRRRRRRDCHWATKNLLRCLIKSQRGLWGSAFLVPMLRLRLRLQLRP
jgi:hypothetical protein